MLLGPRFLGSNLVRDVVSRLSYSDLHGLVRRSKGRRLAIASLVDHKKYGPRVAAVADTHIERAYQRAKEISLSLRDIENNSLLEGLV